MNLFDRILISSSTEDGKTTSKYLNVSRYRRFNDKTDINDFLKSFNLNKIEDFSYKESLGSGKAALTALFENTSGEECVIKFLFMPRNESEYQSFVNEYAALMQLMHKKIQYNATPKIIINFKQYMDFPIYYFGMEFIKGTTLENLISLKPLPWNWKVGTNIILRISLALYEVNINRIIHRDLHPGNIIITKSFYSVCRINKDEPYVRILDLGNKVNWGGELFGDKYLGDNFRLEGAITSWSPEYILDRKKDNDIAQDIWSLGVIFYKLMTNKFPIEVTNISDLLTKYKNTGIHIDWYLLQNIPEPLFHIIKRMLDPNPNTRIRIGPLTNLLDKLMFDDMLDWDKDYLRDYLSKDGLVEDPLDYIY